jgi:hypothetical protein
MNWRETAVFELDKVGSIDQNLSKDVALEIVCSFFNEELLPYFKKKMEEDQDKGYMHLDYDLNVPYVRLSMIKYENHRDYISYSYTKNLTIREIRNTQRKPNIFRDFLPTDISISPNRNKNEIENPMDIIDKRFNEFLEAVR